MKLKSADGVEVVVPVEHLKQHSDVLQHLGVVISNMTIGQDYFIKSEFDMGKVIGVTQCVETTQYDDIVHAKRVGRGWDSRFVLNRKPQPCSHITVVLKRVGDQFRILTAYIGRMAEREPDDVSIRSDAEYMQAKHFWNTHALVWGSQEVVK